MGRNQYDCGTAVLAIDHDLESLRFCFKYWLVHKKFDFRALIALEDVAAVNVAWSCSSSFIKEIAALGLKNLV